MTCENLTTLTYLLGESHTAYCPVKVIQANDMEGVERNGIPDANMRLWKLEREEMLKLTEAKQVDLSLN